MRSWLLLLVACTLLPTTLVGAAAAWLAVSSSRTAAEGRLLDSARGLALALDRQIEVHVAALVALAAAPALDSDVPDLDALGPQAEAVARQLQGLVLLRGPAPDYRLLLDTRLHERPPPGAAQLTDPAATALPTVFQQARPAVSNLLRLRPGLRPAAGIFVPVRRGGEVRFALGSVLVPERISALLRAQRLPPGVTATVTDAAGTVAGRSEGLDLLLGQPRPPRAGLPEGETGIISGHTIADRVVTRIAFARLQAAPGWILWVSVPEATLLAAWARPAFALGLGAVLALVVGAMVALGIARRLTEPLELLAGGAEAVTSDAGAGHRLAAIPPTSVLELERLRVALDGADQALRQRLAAQREAVARLSDSEARFRAMADNIPQLAWMARPDGWTFWYNQRWYDYTGSTLAEMQGEGWRKVHHPDHLERAEAHFRRRVLAGEPWEDTFPLRRYDGAWRWFLSRARPIRDGHGQVVLWFGTNTDITQQREAEAALAKSEERLRLAIDSTGLAILDADIETGEVIASPNLFTSRGLPVPEGGRTTIAALQATLHPDDRERVLADAAVAQASLGPTHSIRRIRRADTGEVRWMEVIGRVQQDAEGRRRAVAVQIDVTQRVAAEEQRLLLAREVDHRAKNVLAVVQALLALTPTESAAARRFADAVSGRVQALARAHALLARERWVGAELRTLVEEELAPYAGDRPGSVVLQGPELRLPAGLAQPLSLVLHELATNAAKYGALSASAGEVAVSWQVAPDGSLEMIWQERGGPPVPAAPHRPGFGSRLVAQTVKHQLHGECRFEWRSAGLRCTLRLPPPGGAVA